jgi:hypothetical protein
VIQIILSLECIVRNVDVFSVTYKAICTSSDLSELAHLLPAIPLQFT